MLIWPDHPAFNTPLADLKGVGPKTLTKLLEEGFRTTGDLLALPPRFYQDRRRALPISQLAPDQEALVEATVISAKAGWSPRTRRRFFQAQVEDEYGDKLDLCWFNCPTWLAKSFPKGRRLRLFGRVSQPGRRPQMAHPDVEYLDAANDEVMETAVSGLSSPFPAEMSKPPLNCGGALPLRGAEEKARRIRPVYPPIGDISSGLVKKLVDQALALLDNCPPLFPADWLAAHDLGDPVAALTTLHRPPEDFSGPAPRPGQTRAFRRLALFELLFWRLMMLRARAASDAPGPRPLKTKGRAAVAAFWKTLPFRPSPEQKRVAAELTDDLGLNRPMSRLLQGEVGGGKTAVAGAAVFHALGRGGQAAVMAPTEVLARQHYDFFKRSADSLGYETVLLTGALAEKEKKAARAALAEGRAQLAIGSQALLSPATIFQNLTLAVIDEQHRFGVRQRLALRRKNEAVDLLAMSATPIPRSLTLMLYGDLDSSSLKGLLPGRSPAETTVFTPGDKSGAYSRFLELVRQSGGQGFVVTPRIEADEDKTREPSSRFPAEEFNPPLNCGGEENQLLPSLDEIQAELAELAGPDLPVASLHGQKDAAQKEAAMAAFRDGSARILVATSIIEVGVDVPGARVMLIIGAERFGLAQLHQLRGRVGRGGDEGWCLLLPVKLNANSEKRLATLAREHNGQALAELDLEMRGPGEQLGLRQSGWPAMRYARLPQDLTLLPKASELAEELYQNQHLLAGLDFKTLEETLTPQLD